MSEDNATRIYSVINHVGSEWRGFARTKLKLSDMDIEECEENYHRDLKEQRYQMVVKWQRRCGFSATTDVLEQYAHSWKGVTATMGQATYQQLYQASNNPMVGALVSHGPATMPLGDRPRQFQGGRNGCDSKSTATALSTVAHDRQEVGSPVARNNKPAAIIPPKAFNSESSSQSSSLASLGEGSSLEVGMQDGKKKKKGMKGTFKKLLKLGKQRDAPNPPMPPTPGCDSGLCDNVTSFQIKKTAKETYQQLSKSKSVYSIRSPKGLCLILNNSFAEHKDRTRHGSEKDVKNMRKLWVNIGCQLHRGEPQCEKTADQMKKLLLEITKVTVKYSFIVIVVMTHGGVDEHGDLIFQGADFGSIKVDEIQEMFNNKNAECLRNIPKFFIFQFCRGHNIDRGVSTDAQNIATAMKTIVGLGGGICLDAVEVDGPGSLLPTTSDLLIAYATQEDHAALRHPKNGSWFINAITNVFVGCAGFEDVAKMLTRVNRAMKEKSGSCNEKDSNGQVKTHTAKAMSMHESSLTKSLYLFPGFHHE